MQRFFLTPLALGKGPGRRPPGRSLLGLLLVALFFLAGQAQAGITYRLTDGRCTDSNRPEIFYPETDGPGNFGPGPTLCADQVFAEITLADQYVPGTTFDFARSSGIAPLVLAFSFKDGARSAFTDFPVGSPGDFGYVRGALPADGEKTLLEVLWFEGWFFRAASDGTWIFGVEFGAGDEGICGLGSIEGPNLSGTACVGSQSHYASVGSYLGWQRVSSVPEPGTAASLALALGIMAGLGRRRSGR